MFCALKLELNGCTSPSFHLPVSLCFWACSWEPSLSSSTAVSGLQGVSIWEELKSSAFTGWTSEGTVRDAISPFQSHSLRYEAWNSNTCRREHFFFFFNKSYFRVKDNCIDCESRETKWFWKRSPFILPSAVTVIYDTCEKRWPVSGKARAPWHDWGLHPLHVYPISMWYLEQSE